jgi:hypothetical protein
MACHWIKFRDADGVEHVAHVNMAKPRRRKCAYCDCPDAKALCDWKMIKPVRFSKWNSINVGDTLVYASGLRVRILSIDGAPGYLILRAQASARAPEYVFNGYDGNVDMFRVERPGTCDKPICYRCRRHVGPNRDYCLTHDLTAPVGASEAQEKLF